MSFLNNLSLGVYKESANMYEFMAGRYFIIYDLKFISIRFILICGKKNWGIKNKDNCHWIVTVCIRQTRTTYFLESKKLR